MPRSLIKVYTDTRVSGPLFDGRAKAAVIRWLDASKKDVAQIAVDSLHAQTMNRSGRATGRYQSEIVQNRVSYGDVRISDPLIYGPWLEGTSERNRSTRFKGYHLWRKARLKARRDSLEVTQRKLDEFIGEMGGGL